MLTDDELIVAGGQLKSQNMHVYIHENNILVDFVLNKSDRGRTKSNNIRKTSWTCRPRPPACCTHEKRKEEILCNKEQSTEQSKVHSIVQSTVQSTGQSNDTYIYGVGIPAVLAIGVCVFFTYNKKVEQVIHEQSITPKRRHKIQKNIQ